jgi:hypothetical protein
MKRVVEKSKEQAPATPPPAIDATVVDAAPPIDAAPALPSASTRNEAPGTNVTKTQTVAEIAAAGYQTKDDVSTSRNGYDKAGFVTAATGATTGVFAHYASEGKDKSITFYETGFAEGAASEHAELDKAGLCVEGVCPGAPLADAAKLNIEKFVQYTVEMNWFFGCSVEGSPLVIVTSWVGTIDTNQHEKPIAFKKLVGRKQTIDALAWGAWEPMGGCVSDCD